MIIFKSFSFLLLILFEIVTVKCQKDVKSSLTFVIDDTGSMWNEIEQVKSGANDIFDAVLKSNESQIENFVLVTFNDPEVITRIVTKDRSAFKAALNGIYVNGGADCPEYCMTGIEKALEISLPSSYLYVATDAAAKDYGRYNHVKALAESKGSQVNFLLTGMCYDFRDDTVGYKEYYDLSKATNGQVFQMGKTDIRDILDYVVQNVKGRRTPLARAEFPPGEHKLNYTVDKKTDDIMISVSGKNPKVDVTDPDGNKTTLIKVVEKESIGIYGTNVSKPGVHTVTIETISKSSVLVTGKTKFSFRHGFSTFIPTSVDDAASRPPSDLKSRLSIQLIEAEGVELTMIKFKDSDNNDITEEIPFTVIDGKRKFYLTDLIDTPKNMFKISILCYDTVGDTYLVRASPTLIEPSTVLEPPKPTPPTVTIDGEPKIVVDYDTPFKLKCKIRAYPKPDVLWQVKETGETVKSTLAVKELPYDYISIAEIENVIKNETYECLVTNKHGSVKRNVAVETKNNYYFTVVEQPTDKIVEYEKNVTLICNVTANPKADLIWFKNAVDIVDNLYDENVEVSNDNKSLIIKNMQPQLVGHYMCEARNKFERKLFHFKLEISGIEPPRLSKSIRRVYARKGSSVDMSCNVTAGKPTPTIIWYFRRKFIKSLNGIINFKNVGVKNAGVYRCIARNIEGSDFHDTELVVEYPPSIKNSISKVAARDGEKVFLKCVVDGVPKPNVRWFKDGSIITSTRRIHIYRDHTLKFTASLEDSGNYTCIAENKHGSVNKTSEVYVSVPVSIESPKESRLKVKVGSSIVLPCLADGYPKPNIQWLFYNKVEKAPTIMKSTDFVLHLPRMQLDDQGFYVCSASNIGGTANVTYDVQVLAPPTIENIYPEKTFKAVVGDLALRIHCKAKGSPKPSVTWLKNGLYIPSGSEWFDIEETGTLVIKNVDKLSAGIYVCEAKNDLGSKQELYKVQVDPYPIPGPAKNTINAEIGKSAFLKCDIPHKPLDSLRWYKDGRLIGEGEYVLKNVRYGDSGIYTCRVSNFQKSRSENVRVKTGYTPEFRTDVDEELAFEEETLAVLDCEAQGEPLPKVTWLHNGEQLNDTDMFLAFVMKFENIGEYTCEVSNEYGTIKRNFNIAAPDCILGISKEFSGNQPLMYKSPLSWPNFDTLDGYMRIRKDEYISLFCPTNFLNFPKSYITAFCQGDSYFKVNGKTNYKYSDLKCNSDIQPVIRKTSNPCHDNKGEIIEIGFSAFGNFLKAYEVCFDKHSNSTIYTKHLMKHNLADVEPTETKWYENDVVTLDFNVLYNCNSQRNHISTVLEKWFHREDECCFSGRQMVDPKDMVPGLAQMATYSTLNVVPHWSTCSAENWEDFEDRVRRLAKTISYELTVYTGISNRLQMQTSSNRTWDVYIDDSKGHQSVPLYLWKVIQDPVTRSSLAVVQVNVPDLEQSDAHKYVLCRDICHEIHWMRNPNWRDVKKAYTYCCSLNDFIRSFKFNSIFDERLSKVLYDVASISDHSLT